MLKALTHPSRCADLIGLTLDQRRYSHEGVTFVLKRLAKQYRQTKKVADNCFRPLQLITDYAQLQHCGHMRKGQETKGKVKTTRS